VKSNIKSPHQKKKKIYEPYLITPLCQHLKENDARTRGISDCKLRCCRKQSSCLELNVILSKQKLRHVLKFHRFFFLSRSLLAVHGKDMRKFAALKVSPLSCTHIHENTDFLFYCKIHKVFGILKILKPWLVTIIWSYLSYWQ